MQINNLLIYYTIFKLEKEGKASLIVTIKSDQIIKKLKYRQKIHTLLDYKADRYKFPNKYNRRIIVRKHINNKIKLSLNNELNVKDHRIQVNQIIYE